MHVLTGNESSRERMFLGANTLECESSRERKFRSRAILLQGARRPRSERAREQKFQGVNWPGSYWPIRSGSELAREGKSCESSTAVRHIPKAELVKLTRTFLPPSAKFHRGLKSVKFGLDFPGMHPSPYFYGGQTARVWNLPNFIHK